MDKDYDLKKSEVLVGQLYPALIAKDGRVIDGLHRLEENEDWRVEIREDVDTPYKYFAARLISNRFRRGMDASEIKRYVNEMAEILYEEGLRAPDIVKKVTQDIGWKSDRTAQLYLDDKYKLETRPKGRTIPDRSQESPKPVYTLADAKNELGDDKVEAIIHQVKNDLQNDPEFTIEVLKKAPEVLTVERKPRVISEGFYKPVLTENQASEFRRMNDDMTSQLKAIGQNPVVVERKKLIESLRVLRVIKGLEHNLYLPEFDSKVVIRCNDDYIDLDYALQYVTVKLNSGYEND